MRSVGARRPRLVVPLLVCTAFLVSCASRIAELRGAIEAAPNAVAPRVALAEVLADEGRIEEALEQYEAAAELDGDADALRLPMARLYARMGLFDDARVCGELLLWTSPRSIEGHRIVARALLSMEPPREADAAEHVRMLAELGETDPVRPFTPSEEGSLMGLLRHRVESGPFVVRAVEEGLASDAGRIAKRAWARLGPIYGVAKTPERRIRVYVFRTREDYLAYAARHRPRWGDYGGFYCPATRKVVTYATPDEGDRRRWLPRILLHELSHALMHLALDGRYGPGHPVWFDEGLAEIHGTAWPDSEAFSIPGSDEHTRARLRWLLAEGTWIPLRRLVLSPTIRSAPQYAQAWALTLWMERNRPEWTSRLLAGLRRGANGRTLFLEMAGDLDRLDEELRRWLQAF